MVIALKTSTATAITYTNCCGAFFIMDAKKFLIGRLISSDGFPVHEKSLKDGYYSIQNIAEILDKYLEHKIEVDELPNYSKQADDCYIEDTIGSNDKNIEGRFTSVFLKTDEVEKNIWG